MSPFILSEFADYANCNIDLRAAIEFFSLMLYCKNQEAING